MSDSPVTVDDRVVRAYALQAALSVPGVIDHASGINRITGRHLPRADVRWNAARTGVWVDIQIAAVWPAPVVDVAATVRATVSTWITAAVGVDAAVVNVDVAAVVPVPGQRVTGGDLDRVKPAPHLTPVTAVPPAVSTPQVNRAVVNPLRPAAPVRPRPVRVRAGRPVRPEHVPVPPPPQLRPVGTPVPPTVLGVPAPPPHLPVPVTVPYHGALAPVTVSPRPPVQIPETPATPRPTPVITVHRPSRSPEVPPHRPVLHDIPTPPGPRIENVPTPDGLPVSNIPTPEGLPVTVFPQVTRRGLTPVTVNHPPLTPVTVNRRSRTGRRDAGESGDRGDNPGPGAAQASQQGDQP